MGKFVALEIGNKFTKVLYGVDRKDEIHIKDYRIVENTDKIFNPEGDLNINEIQPLLKNVFRDMKIRKADCYLTVGSQSGIVRLREMPLVKLKEMSEIVRFEAEQFLPYNIDGFYIDYRINQLKKSADAEASNNEEDAEFDIAEAMIVAAPKEIVDEQVNLVDRLKLNIKRVDYYTDAIYCYFKKYILNEEKNTLVVDLGGKGMKLTMFHGRKYFVNIFSEIGLEDLVERYSEQNDVSINEARKDLFPQRPEKCNTVFNQKQERSKIDILREKLQFSKLSAMKQNPIEYEIEPKLERLYEPVGYEITKMMEFFKTRQFGMNVDEIYIIGGGANMNQFPDFVKYYHSVDVQLLKNIHNNSDITDYDYHLLVPAIGGLLKGDN